MQLFTIGCPEARDKVIGDYDEYNSRLRICSNEMNPIWPDAQPYDNLLYVAVAVVIVWPNRRKMFQRGEGTTAVLMPEESMDGHQKHG